MDILSHGRLVFGVGRGTNPLHYGGFNVPMEESRDRFTEALEIVTQVLSWRMVAGDADLDVATRERNKAMQARLQHLTSKRSVRVWPSSVRQSAASSAFVGSSQNSTSVN